MSEGQKYPVFNGSSEDYTSQMIDITRKRQKKLYNHAREEFDVIVKSYWHTKMITGIIHSSYLHHHDNDKNLFTQNFVKWSGLWFRVIESLNILQDSMILGLEGRTSSAFNLLRPALESIVAGAFYHCLSQSQYRERAEIIRKSDIGRTKGIINLVEEVIKNTADRNSIPAELERQMTRMSVEFASDVHLPKIGLMLAQLEEWEVLPVETELSLSEILHSTLYTKLSDYSHSIYHSSYAGKGIESRNHDVLFGWDVDIGSFKEFANHFRFLCAIILHFFLNLTEEIQKTQSYVGMMLEYIGNIPDMHLILGTIPEQIQDFIRQNQNNS